VKLVIDSWVVGRALEGNKKAEELLNRIYDHCHKICVDKSGNILKEYRGLVDGCDENTSGRQFVTRWFTVVSQRKIRKVEISEKCGRILDDRRDMKFVYVCLNEDAIVFIVSEEYHFVNGRDRLKNRGIELLSLDDALNKL
jgi:hypothetical protein